MNPYFVGAFSVQEVGVGAGGGVGIFSCCKIEVCGSDCKSCCLLGYDAM